MKKLIAVALSLMLLLASVACAESVYVENVSNIELVVTQDGQAQNVNLSGLSATLVAGLSGETPTVRLDVSKDGRALLGATAQLANGRLLVGVDGTSKPFYVDMSAAGSSLQDLANALFANPEALMNMQIPAFTGLAIPRVDLVALGEMLGATSGTDANGARTASIELPYEMINSYLSMLSSYRSMIPAEADAYVGQLFDAIDEMVASDSGFALKGDITDDGVTSGLVINLYPAAQGVTSAESIGALVISLAENQVNVDVQMNSEGQAYNIATLALTSDPAAATLYFSADVMGMASFAFSLYPQDGAQIAAMQLVTGGQTFGASLTYGPRAGGDFMEFALEMPNMGGMSVSSQVADDGNGGKTGDFGLYLDTLAEPAMNVALRGNVTQSIDDRTLANVKNAGMAVDITEMGDELNDALGQLTEYLNAVGISPAA